MNRRSFIAALCAPFAVKAQSPQSQPFKMAVPPEVLQVGQEAFQVRQQLQEELDYQSWHLDLERWKKEKAGELLFMAQVERDLRRAGINRGET